MKSEFREDKYPTVREDNTPVLPGSKQPFDFGIKEFKRVLDRMGMPKAEKNRTIKMYKERLYARVEEVKEKMEKVVPTQEQLHATDIKDAVITTPERSA